VSEERKFTKEHEWVVMENENVATIGISNFAQKQLGDIVSIELPRIGSIFRQMQVVAIIDSVKASSDIYSPLSGENIEVNNQLLDHPEWINESPYELGWILKIRIQNKNEIESLMTAEEYDKYIGEKDTGGK
jgi:glycine cleavage system H protein